MAVVLNAKGTSVTSFQIGKQGPIVNNNSGDLEFTNATNIKLFGGSDEQIRIIETTNAVNYIELTGSITANNPTMSGKGSDGAVGLELITKGTSDIVLKSTSGTRTMLEVQAVASSVNYPIIKPSATGNAVSIEAAGSDTNIDIQLTPKGTGEVLLGVTIAAANSLQAENDQDLFVKGGDSVAADAGDLVLEGGDGTGSFASGDVVIRGGAGGTASGTITLDSGVEVGTPTGGNKGAGSINAGSLYIDGNALPTILSGSAALDFSSIASLGQADLTITITGAVVGDEVSLGLPAAPTSGIIFNAFVSASNTVTVRAHNYTAGAIDPVSATYNVKVFQ